MSHAGSKWGKKWEKYGSYEPGEAKCVVLRVLG